MAAPRSLYRFFIVYVTYDSVGTAVLRNGVVRGSAPLDGLAQIERLEGELSSEAGPGGRALLLHFIPLPESGRRI